MGDGFSSFILLVGVSSVSRLRPSAQNIQQKYAFVKNSAGQLCRVMKAAAVPQTGIRNVAAYNIASANVSSKVARGSDIEPELREKVGTCELFDNASLLP